MPPRTTAARCPRGLVCRPSTHPDVTPIPYPSGKGKKVPWRGSAPRCSAWNVRPFFFGTSLEVAQARRPTMQILPSMDTTRAFAGLRALSELDAQAYQQRDEAFRSSLEASLADEGSLAATSSTLDAASGSLLDQAASEGLSGGMGSVITDPNTMLVTREDIAQLKSSLKKYGLTDQDLEEIEARIDSADGLSWSGFMSFVQTRIVGEQTSVELSVDDKRQVRSLLGKLGFTPAESAAMIDDLQQGLSTKVWGQISEKIQTLSDDTSLSVSASEAGALAKALGLSSDAQTRLTNFFATLGDSELGATAVRSALSAITAEVVKQQTAESKALDEVKELASEVFMAAQKRLFGQVLSDAREDQVSRKAMLAKEMAANISEGQNSGTTGTGNQSVADLAFSTADAANADTSGQGTTTTASGQDGKSGASGQGQVQDGLQGNAQGNAQGRQESAAKENGTGEREKSGQEKALLDKADVSAQSEGESSEADDWDAFWGKIGLDGMAESDVLSGETIASTTSSLWASDLLSEEAATTATFPLGGSLGTVRVPQPETAQNADRYVSSDVLRQVENGMLKNLGQGGHRITLNLTPEDLGAVNVMLTVRDKDVQAVIRTDTPEAAKIIGEQLAKVRESLEQQGLKVTKLEVQTGLAGQDQSSWQGADSHNEAWRQREELSQAWTALRLFGADAAFPVETDVAATNAAWSMRSEGVDLFA
ncbi:hypothetical protein GD604_06775 [Desulfolutivibrio sulfoxidireducens]|nr:hypothetical protein GD604_06775 [Desulfolutivibrio sulfoxidireducens]